MSWRFGPYTIQVCQLPIVINTNYVGDSLEYQLNNAYTQEKIASKFICTYSNLEYSGVTLVEGAKYKSADIVLWEFQWLASAMPSEYWFKKILNGYLNEKMLYVPCLDACLITPFQT